MLLGGELMLHHRLQGEAVVCEVATSAGPNGDALESSGVRHLRSGILNRANDLVVTRAPAESAG
jgi:hypothetical protein